MTFTLRVSGPQHNYTAQLSGRTHAFEEADKAAETADLVILFEGEDEISRFERTARPVRIVVADTDRCPGSREDQNYFEWIVTDRNLNLFGQCIACGQDIRLETNRWSVYILADHEAAR